MEQQALDALQNKFSDLMQWIKPLCRFKKLNDFLIGDYKDNKLKLTFFTKDNQYVISAVLPQDSSGYLGCIVSTRKPRAGENWNRGNDLADGSYSKETFIDIINDIISYEIVKVAKKKESIIS